mmetsp:Transcript_32090/g.80729  ORF Transcript_32090/g.80729 Transcript_32090/m.80729 type:complete len:221 (-) Transcript_32090:488-1150(-)
MLLRDFISRYLESGVKSELGSVHLFPKPDVVREGESGARTQGQEGGGSRYGVAYVASHLSADASSAHNSQSKGAEVAYVSQHSLLHQEPGLQECFTVPEYTMGRLAAANAWVGTAGTVTHLHTDQADNLLCQVAGYKLVRMYPPEAATYMYPEMRGGNGALNTFSPVDAEAPDLETFPLFAKVSGCMETVLGPDDTLFIPCGYWHYVRALTPSFSLNFWF